MIPIRNKPTWVTRKKTVTVIDHIITNYYNDTYFKTSIFKCDISDLFPTRAFLPPMVENNKNEVTYMYKRIINSERIKRFNQNLNEMDWIEVKACENSSESYKIILNFFMNKITRSFIRWKINNARFKNVMN